MGKTWFFADNFKDISRYQKKFFLRCLKGTRKKFSGIWRTFERILNNLEVFQKNTEKSGRLPKEF
jgi:hypothetical protein